MNERYEAKEIEPAVQAAWDAAGAFAVREDDTAAEVLLPVACFRTPVASCTWATCATTPSAT